jgi:aspartate carbamoyltransferase catalytic subunit
MRHYQAGAAQIAASIADIPIINAGDGVGEHPTQALLDLYTIYDRIGSLDNLTVLMAGDILNGRTVHSLIRGLSLYKNNTVYLLSPSNLRLSTDESILLKKRGITLHEIFSEKDIPKNADVWYWTRVQKERFTSLEEYEKVKHSLVVTPALLKEYARKEMILMHPLPRVGEIEESVDVDPRAIYLRHQMRNGMYLRMALLSLILG